MTIYLTPYDPQTLQATGPSVNSGFPSFEAAAAAVLGVPIDRGTRYLIYPGGVFISDYVLRLEPCAEK